MRKRRKVAYVVTRFPCLTETFIAREIGGLREAGVEVVVLAAERGEGVNEEGDSDVTYRCRRISREAISAMIYLIRKYRGGLILFLVRVLFYFFYDAREAARMAVNISAMGYFLRRLDERGIGHIHAGFMNWPGSMAWGMSVISGRTYSLSGHARDILLEGGAMGRKMMGAKFMTCCTAYGARFVKDHIGWRERGRVHMVHHGLEAGVEKIEGKAERRAYSVLAVGRLIPKKGFDVLLEAFSMLAEEFPESRLLLIGDGILRGELEEQARRLGIWERVCFSGWQTREDVLAAMRKAAVLAAPGRVEASGDSDGIPNVILEAYACGAAVIASDAGGIAEAVISGVTGIVVQPEDARALADGMASLLRAPGIREYYAQLGREYLREKFDLEKNVEKLVRLLEEAGI